MNLDMKKAIFENHRSKTILSNVNVKFTSRIRQENGPLLTNNIQYSIQSYTQINQARKEINWKGRSKIASFVDNIRICIENPET